MRGGIGIGIGSGRSKVRRSGREKDASAIKLKKPNQNWQTI